MKCNRPMAYLHMPEMDPYSIKGVVSTGSGAALEEYGAMSSMNEGMPWAWCTAGQGRAGQGRAGQGRAGHEHVNNCMPQQTLPYLSVPFSVSRHVTK